MCPGLNSKLIKPWLCACVPNILTYSSAHVELDLKFFQRKNPKNQTDNGKILLHFTIYYTGWLCLWLPVINTLDIGPNGETF